MLSHLNCINGFIHNALIHNSKKYLSYHPTSRLLQSTLRDPFSCPTSRLQSQLYFFKVDPGFQSRLITSHFTLILSTEGKSIIRKNNI